jgi:hypothetical protein
MFLLRQIRNISLMLINSYLSNSARGILKIPLPSHRAEKLFCCFISDYDIIDILLRTQINLQGKLSFIPSVFSTNNMLHHQLASVLV